jgi:UDP-N-acetylglucosamine--N-acetylmuramyl-(pentapeptide) pyrophosphoryl-undecaprenol N-acetylglucosamine transferase
MGGSQGARGLNAAILRSVEALGDLRDRVHLIHLAGRKDFTRVRDALRSGPSTVFDFCRAMGVVYSATDLIICRAGAMTLQEVASYRLPAVLVPLPTSAGDHQVDNARRLAARGCARWIRQGDIQTGFLKGLVVAYQRYRDRFEIRGSNLGGYFPDQALEAFISDLQSTDSMKRLAEG